MGLHKNEKITQSNTVSSLSVPLNNSFWTYRFHFTHCLSIRHRIPSDSHIVHIFSALCAGFVSTTATSPIWVIKTRLQLDQNTKHRLTAWRCMGRIYRTSGVFGFYKGITASYVGISETVIHFVIYEAIKKKIVSATLRRMNRSRIMMHFLLVSLVDRRILDKHNQMMVDRLETSSNLC